jgi:hypothetical protein
MGAPSHPAIFKGARLTIHVLLLVDAASLRLSLRLRLRAIGVWQQLIEICEIFGDHAAGAEEDAVNGIGMCIWSRLWIKGGL